MPALQYVDQRELHDGASQPDARADILNRTYRALWTNFTAEHQKSGAHRTDLTTNLSKSEVISWGGDNSDNRNISLVNTSIDITFINVFDGTRFTCFKASNMAGDTTKLLSATAYAANYVQSVGTGTFQVGTELNASGTTYIAIVIGV